MILPTRSPSPASKSADWSDAFALQKRLHDTAETLSQMANAVGMAKHVVEYDADRRKRALARAMAAPLAGGASAAAAEAEGRASEAYSAEMALLGKQHKAAMETLSRFEVTKIIWETTRSLLSMQKETLRQL